jgi:AmiR/NasT family two-component response regulator
MEDRPVARRGGELLSRLLAELVRGTPAAVGAALTVREHGTTGRVLAAHGPSAVLASLQIEHTGGPIVTAADTTDPVITDDLWADERWPRLTLAAVRAHRPDAFEALRAVRAVVAVPTVEADGTVVLSVALTAPLAAEALPELRRHEHLAVAAVAVLEASRDDRQRAETALEMLQSRAAIDQAKGAVMALRRCTPDRAWQVLRDTSVQLNVKLRNLAVALVEHLAGAPAEQPDEPARAIRPSARDREAAEVLWHTLTELNRGTSLPTQIEPSHLTHR